MYSLELMLNSKGVENRVGNRRWYMYFMGKVIHAITRWNSHINFILGKNVIWLKEDGANIYLPMIAEGNYTVFMSFEVALCPCEF